MEENAKQLLGQITERMKDSYYIRQRETISQRANVGKLTEEVESLRRLLAISIFLFKI